MLRVPTYLARSPIHGVGVFTPFAIPRGAVLWDFEEGVDWRLTPAELEAFPEPFQTRLRRYCYREEAGTYVLCGDNARYMNHSFDPSCDDRGAYTVARRDIAAFEELTCDYTEFDVESSREELAGFGRADPSSESSPSLLRSPRPAMMRGRRVPRGGEDA